MMMSGLWYTKTIIGSQQSPRGVHVYKTNYNDLRCHATPQWRILYSVHLTSHLSLSTSF